MRSFAVLLLVLTLSLPLSGCSTVFFKPEKTMVTSPDRIGLEYEAVSLRARDGTDLAAWFLPAEGEAKGTVLYLHGVAANISTRLQDVAWLPAAGFNVLALDYRGYGTSAGIPTLAGVQLDIDAAVHSLLSRPDVDPNRIVVLGQSLGASLAVYYVAHSPYRARFRALVLDSPFSDYRLIAEETLDGFVLVRPLKWLVKWAVPDRYSPQSAIEAVSPLPVLFIHGDRDSTIPLEHSQRLFELAGEPKQLWIVHGAEHVEALGEHAVQQRLARFLHERVAGEQVVRLH